MKPEPAKVKILFFQTKKSKTFERLRTEIKDDESVDVLTADDVTTASTILHDASHCLIVFGVDNSDALAALLKLLNSIKGRLRTGEIKAFGYVIPLYDKTSAMLAKYFINDCVLDTIAIKTLFFKTEKYVNMVRASQDTYLLIKKQEAMLNASKPSLEQVKDPFKLMSSDCWLYLGKEHSNYGRETWFFEFRGPPPATGYWEANQENVDAKDNVWWTWIQRQKNDPFIKDTGEWNFWGRKPEFSWTSGRWLFASKKPALVFNRKEGVVDYKIKSEGVKVHIRHNSPNETEVLLRIQTMLDQEIKDKKSKEEKPLELVEKNPLESEWTALLKEEKLEVSLRLFDADNIPLIVQEPEVVDLFETDITFSIPAGKSFPESFTNAVCSFSKSKDAPPTECTAQITGMQRYDGEIPYMLVELKLANPPKDLLDEYVARITAKQSNVVEFLKQAKG